MAFICPSRPRPVARADQPVPFHAARLPADTPPADPKLPPTYSVVPLLLITNASTSLSAPPPTADHDVPFQAATPWLKRPPAYRVPPLTASVRTGLSRPGMPVPTADHVEVPVFQAAMRQAVTGPAVVK